LTHPPYPCLPPDEDTPVEAPVSVAPVRVNLYPLLARAVEEGVAYGFRRAHKHTDNPGEGAIRQAVVDAVLGELCEILKFD